jgi:hypothetical protein
MASRWTPLSLVLLLGLIGGQFAHCQAPAAQPQKGPQKNPAGQVDLQGDPLPPGAVARLGPIRLRHIVRDYSGSACLAFAPDGKTLVSGGDVGLRAWDVATCRQLDWFKDTFPATAAFFSRDGKKLTTADNNGSVRHWDVATGKALLAWIPPKDFAFQGRGAFLSANGDVVGFSSFSGEMRLCRVDTGVKIFDAKQTQRSLFSSTALSPDGKILVTSGEGHRAHLVDVASGKEILTTVRLSAATWPQWHCRITRRSTCGTWPRARCEPRFPNIRERFVSWLTAATARP